MKNNLEKQCTLLLCSCDKYSDIWDPFFVCLHENWKNFSMPVVLNTESKKYSFDGYNITTYSVDKNKNMSWSKRLQENLKRIDTPYVLFMLEDFFITEKVDDKIIFNCINWMDENKNIAVFSFHRVDKSQNIASLKYKNFELRSKNGAYRFNCQTAIWRRERLIEFLNKNESPWEWELYGSIRSRKYKDEFYSIKDGIMPPIIYLGDAVCRGLWLRPKVEPLFKKYNINIDLQKRGLSEKNPTFLDNRTFVQKIETKYKKARAYIQSLF